MFVSMSNRRFASAFALALALAGCGEPPAPGELVQSSRARNMMPDTTAAERTQLSRDRARFALDLYRAAGAADKGNLFFSPHSISLALGMTFAGARGQTADEMRAALAFDLGDRLHPALNDLDLRLTAAAASGDFELRSINQLFGQKGETFAPTFMDLVAEHYGAGMRALDFARAAEPSRVAINDWVAGVTNNRIKDLIPSGTITAATRLVLANAIYFNAKWSVPFEKNDTRARAFHLLDGTQVQVPLMSQVKNHPYAALDGLAAVELPYRGDKAALLVVVPDPGRFAEIEKSLDGALLDKIVAALAVKQVDLALPKWTFEARLPLKQLLIGLGMKLAFDPGEADFTGLGGRGLFLADVLHKAFVRVDEDGTEAAAATAAVVDLTSIGVGEVTLVVDRPFIALLRDRATGAILFAGRVMDPR